ncbi:uncharacterized protein LOC120339420 [Styela clava]
MCSKEKKSISYRLLNVDDLPSVVSLIKKEFITREPMCSTLNFTDEHVDLMADVRLRAILEDNISIGAFEDETDLLVAIRLSLLGRNEKEVDYTSKANVPIRLVQLGALVKYLFGGSKADCLGTKDYAYFVILCTRPEYGGEGIATELYRRSHIIAREAGCKKSAVMASSYYTQRIIKKYQYDFVKTVEYKNYVDPVTGNKVFSEVPSPHVTIALGVKTLEET